MRIGILGGGLSGLTLQRMLAEPSEVLEKEAVFGGLCRTFWKEGYGYDIGGHILFSRMEDIDALVTRLLGENLLQRRRANKVLFHGKYVKYPFENDLAALDLQDRYECLIEYLRANYPAPNNLAEWCYHHFGKGIAERYLLPYNQKIWKRDPVSLGLEWVSRIPRPPLEDVVRSALGIETEGYIHQLYFRYPRRGGIAALIDALAQSGAPRRTSFEVRSLVRTSGGWRVSDGLQSRDYERVVIAFPLPEAVRCLPDPPAQVLNAAARLAYNAVRVVLVVVDNESLLDKSAIYLPDPTILPHRVCFMGYFSPDLVRPGTSSLVAEVTTPPDTALFRMPPEQVVERVVSDLDRIGVVRRSEVIQTDIRTIQYAYPVYTLDHAENTGIIKQYFKSQGLELLGRFAEFDYINMDECLRRARAMAERLGNQLESGVRS